MAAAASSVGIVATSRSAPRTSASHLVGIRVGERERDRLDVDAQLPLQHQVEQRFLALGVGVQEPGRDAGAPGDVAHAGPLVALHQEHLERGLDDVGQCAGGHGSGAPARL